MDIFDFDPDHSDSTHKNNMREFLRALGLFPVGLTMDDIENLSKKLMDNHGKPDRMLVSPQIFADFKKLCENTDEPKA